MDPSLILESGEVLTTGQRIEGFGDYYAVVELGRLSVYKQEMDSSVLTWRSENFGLASSGSYLVLDSSGTLSLVGQTAGGQESVQWSSHAGFSGDHVPGHFIAMVNVRGDLMIYRVRPVDVIENPMPQPGQVANRPDFSTSPLWATGVAAPLGGGEPLSSYVAECNSAEQSRSPECVEAMHRYCRANHELDVAVAMEIGQDAFEVACVQSQWRVEVPLEALEGEEFAGACSGDDLSRSDVCIAAIHSFCDYYYALDSGISQIDNGDMLTVTCFQSGWKGNVEYALLDGYENGCATPADSQSAACATAISRYCEDTRDMKAGFARYAVSEEALAVTCVQPGRVASVPL